MPDDRTTSRRVAPGFNRRLLHLRLERGLTQAELEAAAELPATAISRYERDGGPVPGEATRTRLAEALGVAVEVLEETGTQATPTGRAHIAQFRNQHTRPV